MIPFRFFFSGHIMGQLGVTVEDIVYNTLPLCHSTGGALGLGCMLFKGCTFVLKKKFSACRYWSDAVKYNCTVSYYHGLHSLIHIWAEDGTVDSHKYSGGQQKSSTLIPKVL